MIARLLLCAALALPVVAAADDTDTLKLLHLLDYIAVDYAEAVADGVVIDVHEYEEMLEFAAEASSLAGGLPDGEHRGAVIQGIEKLAIHIGAKQAPPTIARKAKQLRTRIIETYGIATMPPAGIDAVDGARLYARACANCHGVDGRGDGPASAILKPAPTDFQDAERMAERTEFGLYSAITLGVDGTPMASFAHLSDEQRWALARHVSNFLQPKRKD